MSEESQPWDDEPEADAGGGDVGSSEGMSIVAVTLSTVIVGWAFLGTVPRPVILIAGLWIMAATATCIAEVYGS